jgi:antitoxin component YwqK of YwqJK toxin-antitoxin module
LHLYSQEYKYIYYFDKDLSSCKKSSSIITGKGLKENGLFRLDYFSNETGKLLLSVHFTDSTLSVMQGHFKSFYANTVVEQEGDYVQDLKEGLWQ